ncbi:3-deoxy-D-manno-octulosonic acid kinase [Alteromonas lipolytica]|uniref:3-deoxy-D-manno-octulosonic acid kinase n=1 Tax=Alteromonas lipolytica TaxID=1856405 RepID=A0A1E8FIB3_9ALTE|nr:3-deoxy-D-manno-octulosonic acid kinase [Alteromonas lipolytica]
MLLCPQQCDALDIDLPSLQWLQSDYWLSQAHAKANSGRGQAILIEKPAPMVLRQYCRGGLVRHFAERRFIFSGLSNTRPYCELTLLNRMYEAGLPVPRGLAGRVSRYGVSYEASILMERIPDSQEVHEYLLSAPLSAEMWLQVGQLIRQLHDRQIYHHDLNIHNIMLDKNAKLWLIDFDKCAEKTGQTWKENNLLRLQRSLHKERDKCPGYHFADENWQQLLAGYQQAQ